MSDPEPELLDAVRTYLFARRRANVFAAIMLAAALVNGGCVAYGFYRRVTCK